LPANPVNRFAKVNARYAEPLATQLGYSYVVDGMARMICGIISPEFKRKGKRCKTLAVELGKYTVEVRQLVATTGVFFFGG